MQIIPAAQLNAEGIQPAARPEGLYQARGSGSMFESILAASSAAYRPTVLEIDGESDAPPGFFNLKKQAGKTEINYSAIFSGLAFQPRLTPEIEISDEQTLKQCAQIIDSIVNILEGSSPPGDMENLLKKLDSLFAQLEVPLEQNESELAQQITARMPQINAIYEGEAFAPPVSGGKIEGSPCPLENENENALQNIKADGGVAAEKPESANAFGETSTDVKTAKEHIDTGNQPKTEFVPDEQITSVEPPETTGQTALKDNEAQGGFQVKAPETADTEKSGTAKTAEPQPVEDTEASQISPRVSEHEDTQNGQSARQDAERRQNAGAAADISASRLDIAPMKAEAGFALDNAATQQAHAPQATRETLLDTMVEQMTLSTTQEASTVEIELRPDFLGKVSIELSLDQHGLQAKIRADDPGIKNLISGQVNQLIEALNQKGVRVNELEVVYTGPQTQSFEQGGGETASGQQKRGRDESRNRAVKELDAAGFEVPLPKTDVLPESATVQYRA